MRKLIFVLCMFLATLSISSLQAKENHIYIEDSEIFSFEQSYSPANLCEKIPFAEHHRDALFNKYYNEHSRFVERGDNIQSVVYLPELITVLMLNGSTTNYYFTYDDAGKRIQMLIENNESGAFANVRKNTYAYNAEGKRISAFSELWKGDKWVNYTRATYEYNSEGELIYDLYEKWLDDKWVFNFRDIIEFDPEKKIYTWLVQNWLDEQWVNQTLETAFINERKSSDSAKIQVWLNDQWVNYERYIYGYDSQGQYISWTKSIWTDGEWVNSIRYLYDFDANGKRTSSLAENWVDNGWEPSRRLNYKYDDNGRWESELTEEFKDGSWINSSLLSYLNDENGNKVIGFIEKWEIDQWINSEGSFSFTDAMDNFYYFYGNKIELRWTAISSANSEPQANFALELFPNPATDAVNISFSLTEPGNMSLTVYNSLGLPVQKLIDNEITFNNGAVYFDASSVPSGIYYCVMEIGGFRATKSFAVAK